MEETLYDMALFREFVGLDAGEDSLPDEVTVHPPQPGGRDFKTDSMVINQSKQ
ncbi:hypothetical protein GCM10028785_09830 [Hydrogenophaga soli]